jgi:molybdopterin biosynthesis enzyme MoaB
MSFINAIRRIVKQEIPGFMSQTTFLRQQQNQQSVLAQVTSVNSDGSMGVSFVGSNQAGTATVATTRPISIGDYVLVVGGTAGQNGQII